MTREYIEDFREVLLPFVKRWLLGINYENRGKSDAEEFEKDFNAILDLAIKALEQEPKTGLWIDCDNSDDYSADGYDCSVCGVNTEYATSYCPNCGAKMVEPQESEET